MYPFHLGKMVKKNPAYIIYKNEKTFIRHKLYIYLFMYAVTGIQFYKVYGPELHAALLLGAIWLGVRHRTQISVEVDSRKLWYVIFVICSYNWKMLQHLASEGLFYIGSFI